MEKFEALGLCEHVLRVVSDKKFKAPTKIQEKTIPLVLEGKDVIAGSATGSGKTLAFGAGIIKNSDKGKGIQGLILTPTRELAEQVACSMEEFGYHKGLEIAAIYGGVSMERQLKKLQYVSTVVATPGRLLDHIRRNSIDLSNVKFLVLDEADRMWDMGFKDDVGKIVKACPKDRQTLLFSATITPELADFSEKHMKAPVEVLVDNYVDASKLKQIYYDVQDNLKFSLLVHLLKNEKAHLVMIFCNTRRNVDFVVKNLRLQNIAAQAIHGGLTQSKRSLVLKRFDNSNVNVLVCTDVAARGLDITGVSHIYNYDTTRDAKDYVHRIGRTARAGKEGIAINILASRDYDNFANVQKHNPELKIENVPTPRVERVFVKMDKQGFRRPLGRFGNKSTGDSRRRPDGARGPRRDGGRRFGQSRSGGPDRPSGERGPRRDGGRRFGQSRSGEFRSGESKRGNKVRR
jgi:ATP-dependent RNA helicase DeaD